MTENSYDCKLEKSRKKEICNQYHLESKGEYREYLENNVCIIVSVNSRRFNYIEDLSISYNKEKQYLVQEINEKPCIPYNFFNVHQEESYILYENEVAGVKVYLKEYDTYLTLAFHTENISHLEELNIFYI